VIVGAREVLAMNSFHIRPGPIEFVIGEPVSSSGYTARQTEKFAAEVKAIMEDMYYARANVDGPEPAEAPALEGKR